MNDKQRSEFEKWFTSQIDSEYCSANVKALMAECWQAAIASQKALYVATYEQSEPIYLNKEFIKD